MASIFKKKKYTTLNVSSFAVAGAPVQSPPLPAEQPSIPMGMYEKCAACGQPVLTEDLWEAKKVCPACGYHMRLSSRHRITFTVDDGSFEEINENIGISDPLNFPGYTDKLKTMTGITGTDDAVRTGFGRIDGRKAAIAAMEGGFMMGSMGAVVGEKLTRLIEAATENRLPVVIFTISGGARMQEGIISLMQMAKVSGALKKHSDAGLLYITVLTDPTTGGVTASFAMLGDVILSEPGALVGFAGKRVIEQTIRQQLPPGFQSAEFVLQKGFIDAIVQRSDMKQTLSKLLQLHEVNCDI